MSRIWTSNQLSAILARDKNILVSAAAGSGKTAVLVERVTQYITDEKNPIDVDKLLVVTFTNAAASEMKSRISNSLNDIIKNNPNDTNAIRQLSLLPGAKVCTIDSFCINLVRENFFKLDVSQDFGIMENAEELILKQSIVESILERIQDESDAGFTGLCELLSTPKSDAGLVQNIIKVYDYSLSQPFPYQWLDSLKDAYNSSVSIDDSELKKYITSQVFEYANEAIEIVEDAISNIDDDEMYDKYLELLESDKAIFVRLLDLCDNSWDEIKSIVDCIKFKRMPYKMGYDGSSKVIVSSSRDLYKSIVSKDIVPFFAVTSAEYTEDCELLFPIVSKLVEIVKALSEEILASKKELNKYCFADILHFAMELLLTIDDDGAVHSTELANELKDNFAEILVDEYQDTNYAQDALFDALSNGHNRFMVGDIKQSIYRFRLAMPEIFNAKKDEYSLYSDDNPADSQKIFLDKNFRSRKGVCDFTNMVFSNLMSRAVGEINYDSFEYLNNGAEYCDSDIPSVQLNVVNTPVGADSTEYEAHQVAKYIINKVNSYEQIQVGSNKTRAIRYSDFAVLFRSAASNIPTYTKVFTEYGIPVATENKTNLFDCNEVSILLSLIRIIDNPVQDIYLLATLMSAFYGYTADDIASAKVNYPGANLYLSVAADPKFSRINNDLDIYRSYAASMSVESLIRQVISDTSYLSVISAMGNSEQRKQNVLKLIDIAKSFDSGDNVGLTSFVRYVDSIISSGIMYESASVNSTVDDCVKFMSVHKSKGLEFPVCILACCRSRYNVENLSGDIQLNNQGIGIKAMNSQGKYKYETQQYVASKRSNSIAAISENLRVLYVAITRAKEQFVAFSSYSNFDNKINKLANSITSGRILPSIVRHINNDGDMLMMASLLHKDAKMLRDMCAKLVKVNYDYDFDLDIRIIDDAVEEIAESDEEVAVQPTMVHDIQDRLSFSYNRKELSGFISKRTASSLDEQEHSFEFITSAKPAFLQKAGMTAAQKGTAMHAFMQYCDYKSAKSNLQDEIDVLVSKNYLTNEQAECLDRSKLSELFSSDFADRIFSSDNVYREIKVSSFVPVNTLEKTDSDELVLVQGIADCVFEENGELVLVDYKTDKADSEEQLLDRYKNQLGFYKMAIAKTLNKPVKEAMLYSFYFGKCCIYK